MQITVVNKYKHSPTEHDYYIGRGSPLGNKFTHLASVYPDVQRVATRDLACDLHAESFTKELVTHKEKLVMFLAMAYAVLQLDHEINLVCFCSPQRCHGQHIKEMLIQFVEECEQYGISKRKLKKMKECYEAYHLPTTSLRIC